MQTTLHQTISSAYKKDIAIQPSLWTKFITWCAAQEGNRLLWLGVILAVHGCALTPITVMSTLLTGPDLFLFMSAMVAMGIALVTNLAAMPTKVTIPAFALSVLVDIVVLACALYKALV